MNIGNLLPPKMGLKMIKNLIEKQLGFYTPYMKMIYNGIENTITFVVIKQGEEKERRYPYDNDTLKTTIKGLIQAQLQPGVNIDFAVIHYDENKSTVEVYYRENSEKLKKSIEL